MNTAKKVRIKKELVGKVVSDKMDKTVIVQADRRVVHPLYEKVILISKKFVAHDEKNESKIGDEVRIRYARPLSKTKRWVVIETLRKSAQNAPATPIAAKPAKATKGAVTKKKKTVASKGKSK